MYENIYVHTPLHILVFCLFQITYAKMFFFFRMFGNYPNGSSVFFGERFFVKFHVFPFNFSMQVITLGRNISVILKATRYTR
jgi:hypothetical protein